jgi:hypothetical protein
MTMAAGRSRSLTTSATNNVSKTSDDPHSKSTLD